MVIVLLQSTKKTKKTKVKIRFSFLYGGGGGGKARGRKSLRIHTRFYSPKKSI